MDTTKKNNVETEKKEEMCTCSEQEITKTSRFYHERACADCSSMNAPHLCRSSPVSIVCKTCQTYALCYDHFLQQRKDCYYANMILCRVTDTDGKETDILSEEKAHRFCHDMYSVCGVCKKKRQEYVGYKKPTYTKTQNVVQTDGRVFVYFTEKRVPFDAPIPAGHGIRIVYDVGTISESMKAQKSKSNMKVLVLS